MSRTITLIMGLVLSLAASAAQQTLSPMDPAPRAADFSLEDMDGKIHRLSDYAGKPVIVNFWATWCPPCREEMPSMQRAWEAVREEGILMLAINVGETLDQVFPFTANYPVDFPILFDEDSAVINAWPVQGLPTTFVVDPEGRIVYRAIGGREWDDPQLLDQVRGLMRPKP